MSRHFSRALIAGIVALLPVGGLVLSAVWMETTLAESWLAEQIYYFPGMGIVAAVLIIYAIGLVVTTVIGNWIWKRVDRLLDALPAFGRLYKTLKQIAGYGEGNDALFRRVVLVPDARSDAHELGFVTDEGSGSDGVPRVTVFVPGAPNPTTGRLLLLDAARTRPVEVSVSDAMAALIAVGSTPLPWFDAGGDGRGRPPTAAES